MKGMSGLSWVIALIIGVALIIIGLVLAGYFGDIKTALVEFFTDFSFS